MVKALLRKRGEHLERSFCHVLDHGKHRRATLRGRVNLTKRQLVAAFTHNISLLMQHLTGYGTVKQCQAGNRMAGWACFAALWACLADIVIVRSGIGGGCARSVVILPCAAGFCGCVPTSPRIGLFQQAAIPSRV
ncbi:hypothetical protein [Haloferula sargassicola]|uniref:hypothetical protein n=1 Tax=Haloferula sargassicola TaxID=490096 RepID=UPI0033655465